MPVPQERRVGRGGVITLTITRGGREGIQSAATAFGVIGEQSRIFEQDYEPDLEFGQ